MTTPNDPITLLHSASEKDILFQGLTKREYFAAMAMQGLLANHSLTNAHDEIIAMTALDAADALINALNK
jgi:hypothetical protein